MREINLVTVCPTLAALLCCFSIAPGEAAAMSLTKIDPSFKSYAQVTPMKDSNQFVAANVANFAQFSDANVSLDFFSVPSTSFVRNLDTPADGEGAVLTWTMRRSVAGNATYEVRVNGAVVGTYTHGSEERYSVQEALSSNQINAGENTVTFYAGGVQYNGSLIVGDVVLHYRVAN